MKKYLFLLLLLFIPNTIYALNYPDVNSKYVEVYDLTDDKILYELNSNDKISIASLTKIATTITAIENIKNLDEKVTITQDILNTVRWDASIAGLRANDQLTYMDLLYASMLPSGADATNSIAILSSGSIESFVEKMNLLVNKLGLTNTHFVNVTGLDINNHYSSADDIRKLLAYSLKNDTFKKIYTTSEYKLSNGLNVYSTINKYNKYSNSDTSKILGSKTGFTLDAGYCMSSLINKDDHEILVITLKADKINNSYYNLVDTLKLIKFINDNYDNQLLIKKNTLIKQLNVNLSNIDSYSIYNSNNIYKMLPNDYDNSLFKVVYIGIEELDYNNKKNDNIGKINYYYDNELLLSEDVILNSEIKFNILKYIKKYLIYIISIALLIIFILVFIIKLKRRK
ncbi:MAG: D-alanyl-D-alanine carboxypeptidase [Bacilli bacterium]|nr:D-alanyl-D-alanine carboxypeptidase [Bacilli bacterium]